MVTPSALPAQGITITVMPLGQICPSARRVHLDGGVRAAVWCDGSTAIDDNRAQSEIGKSGACAAFAAVLDDALRADEARRRPVRCRACRRWNIRWRMMRHLKLVHLVGRHVPPGRRMGHSPRTPRPRISPQTPPRRRACQYGHACLPPVIDKPDCGSDFAECGTQALGGSKCGFTIN